MHTAAPTPLLIVLLAVAAVALGGLIVWGVLRWRYRRRVRELGWEFDPHPSLRTVWGLNCPPFGLGGARSVDDAISGTTPGGVPFVAVRYESDAVPRRFVGRFPLPRPLPEAHLSHADAERPGLTGVGVRVGELSAIAQTAQWASEAGGRLAAPLTRLAAVIPQVSASLDGDSLVLCPLPRDPDWLARAVALADDLVAAAGTLQAEAPPPPPELSVYGHPDWVYRVADDDALAGVAYTRGGFNHATHDVIHGGTPALRLVGLTHTWDTHETRMVGDGKGGMVPQTYVKHHREEIAEIGLGFDFGELSVNTGHGHRLRFESEDFNRSFAVRASDERFAYDVVHPQMMDWLLAHGAPTFAIEGRRMAFDVSDVRPATLAGLLEFAASFFGRVRRYTWENLGLDAPPVPPAPAD